MTLDEHYRLWRKASGHEADLRMQEVRKRVAENRPDDWLWLRESLSYEFAKKASDRERKWFVFSIFDLRSVPEWLFSSMLLAGVFEPNPSLNRRFIEPCVRSFGARRVLEELLRHLETGTDIEKAGAASALYWVNANPKKEELGDVHQRIRCQLLREFIDNADIEVRRNIIPGLDLEPKLYPEEYRALVPIAVEIARSAPDHPDEYIRHRVEIQLRSHGSALDIHDDPAYFYREFQNGN
jgi:hypothetical protein